MNTITDTTLLALAARIEVLSRVVQEVCRSMPAQQAECVSRELHVREPWAAVDLFDAAVDEATAAELAGVLRALSSGPR